MVARLGDTEFLTFEENYSTAQIEMIRFCGEVPNPVYFASPKPAVPVAPIVFAVIDGEARVVRSDAPPGAQQPNLDSLLFKPKFHRSIQCVPTRP